MRLIRIEVEKIVTCPTTVVSCCRQSNFSSSSLMQRTLPDTSESSLAEKGPFRTKPHKISSNSGRFSVVVKCALYSASGHTNQQHHRTIISPASDFRRCTPYVTFNIQRDVLLTRPPAPCFHTVNLCLDELLDILRCCRSAIKSFF